MDELSDRALVRRLLAGDERAFDEFFADYFPRLFRFAVARVRDDDAAEEVVQATLVRAVRKLDTWRGEASLFTWLCTICRREIGDWAERAARRPVVPLVEGDPDLRAALDSLAAAQEGAEAMVARREVGRMVQLALDHLPPRYSRALEWKYLEDLSMHEIAARLDTTPKAVESLLSRARDAFREAFVLVQREPREN